VLPVSEGRALRSQEVLYRQARAAAEEAKRSRYLVFEPQRPAVP